MPCKIRPYIIRSRELQFQLSILNNSTLERQLNLEYLEEIFFQICGISTEVIIFRKGILIENARQEALSQKSARPGSNNFQIYPEASIRNSASLNAVLQEFADYSSLINKFSFRLKDVEQFREQKSFNVNSSKNFQKIGQSNCTSKAIRGISLSSRPLYKVHSVRWESVTDIFSAWLLYMVYILYII